MQDHDLAPARVRELGHAFTRRSLRKIRRPQDARLLVEVGNDVFLVPHMIAGGNGIGASIEEFVADFRRNTEPAGRVLAVDDHEIDRIPVP